ncbi:lipid-A-disaccharide synthase [uncultured Pseudoteredinibacter sp.]|uniref:lipid-A-disaccharide synthase n=1 Tax=uncultured Pseudoteredinibacter sp. TaxID=1641701 RepID=UPI002603DFC1|nr:lipid-A-disaccharide synthase [uncultured Pseudoteredinibacter sp.]
MHIAIVVGEMSGDILGADLMQALRQRFPDASFSGIGGERMLALGFESFFPQDRLAVMGFIEPLKRLPELLRIRKFLRQHFLSNPPDVFIGIDSPDFNLPIEKTLKEAGIPTVHYVSPSVWAWRQGRIHGIKRSVDLMLTILPFETEIYKQHDIPVQFVGHPLADDFDLETDVKTARQELGLDLDEHVVAIMPGSRGAEVKHLAPVFLKAAAIYAETHNTHFLLPAANQDRLEQLKEIIAELKNTGEIGQDFSIDLHLGNSKQLMAAADGVLMASGTTSLEALLLKKPMVVAYKKDWFSAWLTRRLIKTKYISLPNLLAGEELVPEILQEDCTAENLVQALRQQLQDQAHREQLVRRFTDIHKLLRQQAGELAAKAIDQQLLSSR